MGLESRSKVGGGRGPICSWGRGYNRRPSRGLGSLARSFLELQLSSVGGMRRVCSCDSCQNGEDVRSRGLKSKDRQ